MNTLCFVNLMAGLAAAFAVSGCNNIKSVEVFPSMVTVIESGDLKKLQVVNLRFSMPLHWLIIPGANNPWVLLLVPPVDGAATHADGQKWFDESPPCRNLNYLGVAADAMTNDIESGHVLYLVGTKPLIIAVGDAATEPRTFDFPWYISPRPVRAADMEETTSQVRIAAFTEMPEELRQPAKRSVVRYDKPVTLRALFESPERRRELLSHGPRDRQE